MQPIKSYDAVFFVESSKKSNVIDSTIAINPKIAGNEIFWGDTNRGIHRNISQLIKDTPEEIVFREGDEILTLSKLTVKVYNTHFKRFNWGSPDFRSDKDLQDFYRNW